jgi:hypothetical protein
MAIRKAGSRSSTEGFAVALAIVEYMIDPVVLKEAAELASVVEGKRELETAVLSSQHLQSFRKTLESDRGEWTLAYLDAIGLHGLGDALRDDQE